MKKFSILVLFLLSVIVAAKAQLPTATILGSVHDPSGALIPGATITIKDVETGQIRTVKTEPDGTYRVEALAVGNYELRAEMKGFETEVRSGLTLNVAQQAVVDFGLSVGASTQEVNVKAEAPVVNTTSGALGGLVNEHQMSDLPLNGRNYIQLALLQNGITELKNRVTSQTALATQGTFFSSNGAPPRSNAYLLDGTSLVTYGGASGASISGSTLGLDGIREFRVITNSFGADYGMSMGSQMLMVSKGGTNDFHGDVFEFLRNSALDARNYFDTVASAGKTLGGQQRRLPPFRRNNFGGAFGGPIRKNKIFFFGVYEGLRQSLGTTNLNGTIPLGCRGAAGTTITNAQCPQLGTTPSVTIASVIAPWLNLFPNPNIGTNQISFGFNQPTQEDYGQMRVDQTISAKDNLFVRYTIDNTTQIINSFYPGSPQAPSSRAQFTTITENHIFSPTLLNAARFSFSRSKIILGVLQFQTGPNYSYTTGLPMGTVSIAGVTTTGLLAAGGNPTSEGLQDIFAYSDDLYKAAGKHSIKMGTLINHYQVHAVNGTGIYGSIAFANLGTFLQGAPTTWSAIAPGFVNQKTVHFNTLGFYVQDDYRVTPRLTLNLGLRYEFNTDVREIHGNESAIRNRATDLQATIGPMTKNPSYVNIGPRLGFAWDVFGHGNTSVRGGFAELYNIAGWVGIMNQSFRTPPYENQVTVSNPGSFTVPFTFPASTALSARSPNIYNYDMKQSKMLQYNLAVQQMLPSQMALTVAYAGSRGYHLITFTEGNPIIPAGVPGTTGGGLEICVARPGGQPIPSTNQLLMTDGIATACWLGTETRTNPNWGTMGSMITAGGDSWYNSLQVGLEKHVTHNLQFQSNFTWSRLFDTTQCQSNMDALGSTCMVTDPFNPRLDRAPASFDIPFAFRFNALYRFPEFSGKHWVGKFTNGWGISPIVQLQSGYPFSPTFSTSRSKELLGGNTGGVDRPNLVPSRNNGNITHGTSTGCQGVAAGTRLGTPTLYFDPCAYTIQPSGFLGNAGRNSLRGPNFKTVDFSVAKDTKAKFLGEAGSIEIRGEFFNIFNRTNFGVPVNTIFAGTGAATGDVETPLNGAGSITAASPSRQVQLALKVIF